MNGEVFRNIKGYEGKYLISNYGRVFCIDRNKIKTMEVAYKGYLRVDLRKNGERKHHKVHRLVADAFIPNTDNKPQVNHIDGNKQNNHVANLEWVTNQENCDHRMMMRRLHENRVS